MAGLTKKGHAFELPDRVWTVRDIAECCEIGPVTLGNARQAADAVEAWMAETGVNGLNLAYAVLPETFEAIAEHLVLELQRLGRCKRAYRPGTMRAKLFGQDQLAAPHPAAAYNWSWNEIFWDHGNLGRRKHPPGVSIGPVIH